MKSLITILKQHEFRTFLWVWFGQFISITGTAMSRFALMIYAYQQTSSATTLALLGVANYVPFLLFSPLAGVFVDRWDRRKLMLLADSLAGAITALLLVLYITDQLEVWHLYLAEAFSGAFEAFQLPAYSAAVTTLVPMDQLNRTNGLRSLARNTSTVMAPLLAGAMLAWFGIQTILLFDLTSFVFSAVVLSVIFIPRPIKSVAGEESRGSVIKEMRIGLAYILERRGLLSLLLIMLGMNLLASLTYFSILPAMILARSGNSEWTLGVIQSMMGVGGIIGALLLSTWGGPRRKIDSVLIGGALSFLLGDLLFGLGQGIIVWSLAAFFSTLFIPFVTGNQQSIWQLKVPQDLQGRVFSVKETIQQVVMPFGYLFGGLLADRVFEPIMNSSSFHSNALGTMVGSGPGAGMGLMFLF